MRAYKFRAANQFDWALDIIFEQRLFCASWETLNDPVEGTFVYSISKDDQTDYGPLVSNISAARKKLRVCSLSKTFDSHLMWAHYASVFTGMAIEVELPEGDPLINEVDYGGVFGYLPSDRMHDADAAARLVLSCKNKEWKYEREVRVLSTEVYYKLPTPVRRVIIGERITRSVLKALEIICKEKGIELCQTGIGDEGIDADVVYSPSRERNSAIPY